jgi:hypothetical protein
MKETLRVRKTKAMRKWRLKPENRIKELTYTKERNAKTLSGWEGFIVPETQCEICGKQIFFNKKDNKTAIHFDHRDENCNYINETSPTNWLRQNVRTKDREELWNKCNFGMLCNFCNRSLITVNRKRWLSNAVKYVFGKEFNIV